MPWLFVTLRYHDAVVEERLCAVHDELVLGEHPDAAVAFPGCHLLVRKIGDRIQVAGRWLDPGQRMDIRKPPMRVTVEAVAPRPQARSLEWVPDPRLMVLSGAIVLIGAWLDTAHRIMESHPVAVATVQHRLIDWTRPEVQASPPPPRVTVAQPGRPVAVWPEESDSSDLTTDTGLDPYGMGSGGDDLRWPPAVYQEGP